MHETVQIMYLSVIFFLKHLDLQWILTTTQTTAAEDTKMARAATKIRRALVISGDVDEFGSALNVSVTLHQ